MTIEHGVVTRTLFICNNMKVCCFWKHVFHKENEKSLSTFSFRIYLTGTAAPRCKTLWNVSVDHKNFFKQTQKGCKECFERDKSQRNCYFIEKCRSPKLYKLKVYGRQKRYKFTLTLIYIFFGVWLGLVGFLCSP